VNSFSAIIYLPLFRKIQLIHTLVSSNPSHFAGWPANNGAWSWRKSSSEDEFLVGFTSGAYQVQPGHNILQPYTNLLARSLDGGFTWQVEAPGPYVSEGLRASTALSQPLDFTHPGFCLRVFSTGYHGCDDSQGGFFASQERGHTWQGPYTFKGLDSASELAGLELTPRTDYIIDGSRSLLLLLSARPKDAWGSDRVFTARTDDGGLSFRFLSWMVPPSDPYRAVMPATVSLPSGRLVSAVRRRDMRSPNGWIDTYTSEDRGASWRYRSRVAETGSENGNPPALACLPDGSLVCVYGNRSQRQVLSRLSRDEGASWEAERVLRTGYASLEDDADFGYPRLLQRSDGRLVAVYYWADAAHPQQHIAATIFDPDKE
jgi:hypothetical protein